jgi:hypothetical protein
MAYSIAHSHRFEESSQVSTELSEPNVECSQITNASKRAELYRADMYHAAQCVGHHRYIA